MNLYLLLAIALGAIAGTTEAPVVRPALSAVVAKSGVRAERQMRSVEGRHSCLPLVAGQARVPVLHHEIRVEAPLTGATTPRAPTV
jgi:hypothetical protein